MDEHSHFPYGPPFDTAAAAADRKACAVGRRSTCGFQNLYIAGSQSLQLPEVAALYIGSQSLQVVALYTAGSQPLQLPEVVALVLQRMHFALWGSRRGHHAAFGHGHHASGCGLHCGSAGTCGDRHSTPPLAAWIGWARLQPVHSQGSSSYQLDSAVTQMVQQGTLPCSGSTGS